MNLWKEGRDLKQTDYYQCIDALDDIKNENSVLSGIIAYVENNPVAWSLGELLPDSKTYLVHFEKGDNNSYVKELQEGLLKLGYSLPQWGADGDFGNHQSEAESQCQNQIAKQKNTAAILCCQIGKTPNIS